MDKEIKVNNSEVSLEKANLRSDGPAGQEALVHTSFEYDRPKNDLRNRETKAAARAPALETETAVPTPSLEAYQTEECNEPCSASVEADTQAAHRHQKEGLSIIEHVIEWMAAAIRRLDSRIFRSKKKVEPQPVKSAAIHPVITRKRRRLKKRLKEPGEESNVEWEEGPVEEFPEKEESLETDQTPPKNLEDELEQIKKKEAKKPKFER